MKTFKTSLKYNEEKCEFFGLLGIIHQLILGVLTFSLLVLKRYLENPRRPWIIWFYDIIKQIFSSFVLYSINIVFSYILSNNEEDDICTVYFMNLFLGCIGGYHITSLYLVLFNHLKKKYKLAIYINELYYEEIYDNNNAKCYKVKWKIYIYETIMWTIIQLIWKFILLILFHYFKALFISFGDKCLKPFTDVHVRSFFIICVFPLLLNGYYYWRLDSLIKSKEKKTYLKLKNISENNIDNKV